VTLLRRRARTTVVLLALSLVALAMLIAFSLIVGPPGARARDLLPWALEGALTMTAAVAFVVWLRTARDNLARLCVPGPRWAPQWTFWSWVIPGANLVIPLMVVGEIDRASAPRTDDRRRPVYTAWAVTWTAFLGTYYISRLWKTDSLLVVGSVIQIVAGVFAILLVLRITRHQDSLRPHPVGGTAR
jgi:hypothetical protein